MDGLWDMWHLVFEMRIYLFLSFSRGYSNNVKVVVPGDKKQNLQQPGTLVIWNGHIKYLRSPVLRSD